MARRLEDLVPEEGTAWRRMGAALDAYRRWLRGEIALEDPSPPTTFAECLVRLDYSLWYWTGMAIVVLAMAAVYASSAVPILMPARYVLGTIFVLFMPGYSLVRLLYPRDELSPLEELALSIGLSLALVPLIGLALNYTPWGIRLDPVSASLSIACVSMMTGGLYRKYVTAKKEAS
ncbi:MAG: DUF1616 domain-containing protein [Desulfurococcaceae archaeon]